MNAQGMRIDDEFADLRGVAIALQVCDASGRVDRQLVKAILGAHDPGLATAQCAQG